MGNRLGQKGGERENQSRTADKSNWIEDESFGPDFYEDIDEKEKARELHGPHFYHAIGRKGGKHMRGLRQKGKLVGKNKSTLQ